MDSYATAQLLAELGTLSSQSYSYRDIIWWKHVFMQVHLKAMVWLAYNESRYEVYVIILYDFMDFWWDKITTLVWVYNHFA